MYGNTLLLSLVLIARTAFSSPIQRSFATPPFDVAGKLSYTGFTGPLGWTGLSPQNTECSTSSFQSPINLDRYINSPATNPHVLIPDVEHAEFENLGSTVEVTVNGTTIFNNRRFNLLQFHFHTPSEHRINEEYYPLEAHFVHKADDGTTLVLGVLFELTSNGNTTQLLTAVTKNIDEISEPGSSTETGPLRFSPLIAHFQRTPLFYYIGSLTTPPCTSGVIWLVSKEPLPLDVGTYLALKKVMKFNSRYTQNTPGYMNLIMVAASQLSRRRLWTLLSSVFTLTRSLEV
ncbi:Alpha carbonic anhydrase 4 [Hypsizygus marmoreus]|uniref:Carbonic anhydrase n=1 Tax=Hypsizygus marmoreus TaxID=39966 RepID=A0A369J3T1_HYPMA|nr:Alpha carbonic anhydrase 4 [Hypsizygus marmoreus]